MGVTVSSRIAAWLRATAAATIGLLPVLPVVAEQLGLMGIPWVAATVATAVAITRILSSAPMQAWITRFAPWINPDNKDNTNE